jgi:glycerophosphoryl diester phosphodiesterase
MTADGVVVVTHDPRLHPDIARDRSGNWVAAPGPAIRSLLAAELAEYDVGRLRPGSRSAALFPQQVPRDGATIPRLADVLRLDGEVGFTIELKTFPRQPGLAAEVAVMAEGVAAEAAAVADRVVVQSFDWRGPRHLRRTHPAIRLAWLTSAVTVLEARTWWDGPHPGDFGGSVARAVAAEGGPTWAPEYVDLSGDRIAEAHALGLRVVPWTVNRVDDMRRLIGWGVDGLISDRPDLARGVLAELGLPLSASRQIEEIRRR